MKFEIEFGPCPVNEDPIQLDVTEDQTKLMIRQCRAWRDQLEKVLQQNREYRDAAIRLKVKHFVHEFGTYYEVVGSCDDSDSFAVDALLWLDANAPDRFDDEFHTMSKTQRELLHP